MVEFVQLLFSYFHSLIRVKRGKIRKGNQNPSGEEEQTKQKDKIKCITLHINKNKMGAIEGIAVTSSWSWQVKVSHKSHSVILQSYSDRMQPFHLFVKWRNLENREIEKTKSRNLEIEKAKTRNQEIKKAFSRFWFLAFPISRFLDVVWKWFYCMFNSYLRA